KKKVEVAIADSKFILPLFNSSFFSTSFRGKIESHKTSSCYSYTVLIDSLQMSTLKITNTADQQREGIKG
ncbi:hypothetical protein C0J52_28031, partial [Blattella germanica]